MPRSRVWLAAVVGLVVGCWEIDVNFSTDSESRMTVVVGDLSGPCEGTTTVEEAGSTAVVSRAASETTCAITVELEATLLDMAAIREDVEAEIVEEGYRPEEVKVKLRPPLTLLLSDFRLEGLAIPSTSWSLWLDLMGRRLFVADGPDLAALAASEIAVEFTEDQVDLAELAYEGNAPLVVTGQLLLGSVPLDYLATLPSGSDVRLTLGVLAELEATGSKEIF